MKSRELIRVVERAGAQLVRKSGDHHVFKFPNGRVLPIPHGGSQNEVSPGIVAKARRFMRECSAA